MPQARNNNPQASLTSPDSNNSKARPQNGTPRVCGVLTDHTLSLESKYALDCVFAAVFPDEIELRQVNAVVRCLGDISR
jgi:hypothetical protein